MTGCTLVIRHLDDFPYGGQNRVQFRLDFQDGRTVDLTAEVGNLLTAYLQGIGCSPEEVGGVERDQFYTTYYVVQTGESYGMLDFADTVSQVFSLPIESYTKEGKEVSSC